MALGEAHWLQPQADVVGQLLRHPDFARTVQTIVVEFGNAYYQSLIDRFIAGEPLTEVELRWVWRNVGGAGQAFESPIYGQFFHTVRAINQGLPPAQQLQVLLGDPPVDWQSGRRDSVLWKGFNPRDAHYADIVERHVLAQGRRALLIAGAGHFSRISDADPQEGNVVQRLELRYPGTVFVIVPHVIFDETMAVHQDEIYDLEKRLASWPVPALASVRGTWLGEIPAYLHFDNIAKIIDPDGTERFVRVPYIGRDGVPVIEPRLGDMVDALLYLGPQHRLTFTPPEPRSGLPKNSTSNHRIPFPTARWEEASPHEHGMQEDLIQLAHQKIRNELPNIYSLLVIRHGVIVYEQYYQEHDAETLFDVRSVTKSLISALIGIALGEKNILNLDQTILSYFPEYKANNMDPRKTAITIKDLLTMTSGIAWDEDDELESLFSSDNWIQYIFSRPMADNPGNVFNYNSGASHILSELIRRVTGMNALEFARQRLFSPLGIQRVDWQTDPMGIPFGFAGLSLTARDLAKLGLLYLRQGMWHETQILTPDYVHASTTVWSSGGFPEEAQYGYHWWVLPSELHPAFFAAGYGGQYLWAVPNLDLIVVIAAEPWLPVALIQDHNFLITDFLVPAVIPNTP